MNSLDRLGFPNNSIGHEKLNVTLGSNIVGS